jgi:hypothetical protein
MPTTDSHREWARVGATARLEQFRQERVAILRAFPELRQGLSPGGAPEGAERPKRKSTMSPAARRAVSQRMRAYWAKRRAEKRAAPKTR